MPKFTVKKSQIENAGAGLYSNEVYKTGDIVLDLNNRKWYKLKWENLRKRQIMTGWYIYIN